MIDGTTPEACGCLGCLEEPVAVIDHPTKGERTVCKQHINGYRVKWRVARV